MDFITPALLLFAGSNIAILALLAGLPVGGWCSCYAGCAAPGLPVANGQKTTLSRRPAWTERAKLCTAEVLAYLEGVLAVWVDVLVTAR